MSTSHYFKFAFLFQIMGWTENERQFFYSVRFSLFLTAKFSDEVERQHDILNFSVCMCVCVWERPWLTPPDCMQDQREETDVLCRCNHQGDSPSVLKDFIYLFISRTLVFVIGWLGETEDTESHSTHTSQGHNFWWLNLKHYSAARLQVVWKNRTIMAVTDIYLYFVLTPRA